MRPGVFISAESRRSRSCSKASTRQKSSVSPTASRTGSRWPRRRPTPPTSVSSKPRKPPEPVSVVPAGLAADSLDRRERLLRRRSDSDHARCDGPLAERHAAPVSPSVSRQRIRPPGLGELPVLVRERALDRLAEASRADRKQLAGRSVANEGVVAQALDEFAADARIHRSHDAKPEPGV